LSLLKLNLSQSLKIKVGMETYESDPRSSFDIINKWYSLDPSVQGQSYVNLPVLVNLAAGQTTKVQFEKGEAHNPLILFFPQNASLSSNVGKDVQSVVVSPVFGNVK
jgi:hypothetical protein